MKSNNSTSELYLNGMARQCYCILLRLDVEKQPLTPIESSFSDPRHGTRLLNTLPRDTGQYRL